MNSIFCTNFFKFVEVDIQTTDESPDTSFTPSLFKILRISFLSIVSGDNHTLRFCNIYNRIQIQSMHKYHLCTICFIRCCCLNNASKSFNDTAILSFPKRFVPLRSLIQWKVLWRNSALHVLPGIKNLLHIFCTSDVSSDNHWNTDCTVDLV